MPNNRYIGARYVPKFDGAWDSTKSYEPLVIVESQGNSYTSKTYVPIGVDISNTTYWALTGNYNAQVEQYRREVLDIISRMNGYDAKMLEYDAIAAEALRRIPEFEDALDVIRDDIRGLDDRARGLGNGVGGFEPYNVVSGATIHEIKPYRYGNSVVVKVDAQFNKGTQYLEPNREYTLGSITGVPAPLHDIYVNCVTDNGYVAQIKIETIKRVSVKLIVPSNDENYSATDLNNRVRCEIPYISYYTDGSNGLA